jgi:sporulation integral membrane protein YlbJ
MMLSSSSNKSTYKSLVYSLGILLLLCFLLFFPKEGTEAARDGLGLWLNTLLPTLLPFLILSGILTKTGVPFACPKTGKRWIHLLFGLSPAGFCALLLGLLCGYPMGARTTSDLYTSGRISLREAKYLSAISSQASPAFLINYLALQTLGGTFAVSRILAAAFLSLSFTMLFFRFTVFHGKTTEEKENPEKKETPRVSSPGAIVDVSIMNGFETITRLGGYILLFAILSAMLRHFWPFQNDFLTVILGCLEVTYGLRMIALSAWSLKIRLLLALPITCFGGCCVLVQIRSVMNPKIPFRYCLCSKILQAVLAACLVLFLF